MKGEIKLFIYIRWDIRIFCFAVYYFNTGAKLTFPENIPVAFRKYMQSNVLQVLIFFSKVEEEHDIKQNGHIL